MADGMNKVMLFGNLGADPDVRANVLSLRLATTESYFDKKTNERKERTDWHSVKVFGARGEALGRILRKGDRILVEGRLQTSSYEKDGQKVWTTDVVATNVILGGKGNGAGKDAPAGGGGQRSFKTKPDAELPPDGFDEEDAAF